MFPAESDAPAKKQSVIKASLIFELPTPTPDIPIEEIKEEKPVPVEPEETLLVEPVELNEIEPIPKPEVIPITQTPTPKVEVQERFKQKDQNKPIGINTPAAPSSDIRAPATSMARRHLGHFQQQQQNKMAEQASRYYQEHKNSPVINSEVKNPFMTEDEKLRDSLKVRADCSSTSKKTTAVLLGFLGAQIDCSKPPPINSFIQDRINKDPLLPRKYQQIGKSRPQSIVIKKE